MMAKVPQGVLVALYLLVMLLIGYGMQSTKTVPPITQRCLVQH